MLLKLQDVLLPIDSHWPVEKYKAIDDAYNDNDKEAQAEARKDLAAAFRLKAKAVNLKYIAPPKSTDFRNYICAYRGIICRVVKL